MKFKDTFLMLPLIVFVTFVSFVGFSADFYQRDMEARENLERSQNLIEESNNNSQFNNDRNSDSVKNHEDSTTNVDKDSQRKENVPDENKSINEKKKISVKESISEKSTKSDKKRTTITEKVEKNSNKSERKNDSNSANPPVIHKKESVNHFDNVVSVRSGDTSKTIATVSGNGSVRLVFSRDSKSSAPNLPTFVSVICGADSVYSGAFNTSIGEKFAKEVPFKGNCTIKALVSYPSSKWRGSYNAVNISYGKIDKLSGNGYSSQAQWNTRPVSKSSNFNLNTPSGFKGLLVMKLTACSSPNGASDKTAKNACTGYVQKDVGSSGIIEVKNGGKVITTQNFNISYKKHHDTFSIPLPKLKNSDLTVTVKKNSGSAVLVHGTGGSAVVGTH